MAKQISQLVWLCKTMHLRTYQNWQSCLCTFLFSIVNFAIITYNLLVCIYIYIYIVDDFTITMASGYSLVLHPVTILGKLRTSPTNPLPLPLAASL